MDLVELFSFELSGSFAAFKDPSVTSNVSVYYIPSKSSVIGLLGAIIGIPRDKSGKPPYSEEYLRLFKDTKIGITLLNNPTKFPYNSINRNFGPKREKMPTKKELLIDPKYRIYFTSTDEFSEKIISAIKSNQFVYTPYLGQTYCHAMISDLVEHGKNKTIDSGKGETSSVVLDESETYNKEFILKIELVKGSLLVERHMHHFFENGKLNQKVLLHWIPVQDAVFRIKDSSERNLSNFIEIDKKLICMY
ncbi:MAG: CRISPR-associated protein Cas5 [Rhabdochlamydiaceae bacterium]